MNSCVKANSRGVPPACGIGLSGSAVATTTCIPHRFLPRHVVSPRSFSTCERAQACHLLSLAYVPTGFNPASNRSERLPSLSAERQPPPQMSHGPPRNSRLKDRSSSPPMAWAWLKARSIAAARRVRFTGALRPAGIYAGMLGSSVNCESIHVFLRLNNSGRCAISADRLRRYRSRQSVRCLTSRSAAFCSDSSVSTQAPSTRIAPVGGLPLGRFCGDAISKGKERARYRLNARSAVAAREGMRS